ncbi:MAG: ThiF family adenylyltransferase [Synergistaceae bacterium]|nr:ThiF family adenylyltransferase [Synergistaceae bacterium]
MSEKIKIHSDKYQETAFDRAKLISWWSQDVVSSGKILVAGAGATGNETLKNLALMGFGNIFICDMDEISVSNLSRTVLFDVNDVGKLKAEVAAQRVKAMSNNPDCKVDYFSGDIVNGLGHGVFRRFDVILGCLDNILTRLNVNRRCCLFQKPYIDAGISELGLTLSVHHYPESSCYECGTNTESIARERKIRYSCDVFKQRAIREKHAATVLISAAIVSALQVQEAVKILHAQNNIALEVPAEFGKKYYYQGTNHTFERFSVPSKSNCPAHFSINSEDIIETELSSRNTLHEALEFLREKFGFECVIDTYPDSFFVTEARCINCGRKITVNKPMFEIFSDEFYCDECRGAGMSGYTPEYNYVNLFSGDMTEKHLLDYTLEQIGIPPLHVITVREKNNSENLKYIELTADLKRVLPNIYGLS